MRTRLSAIILATGLLPTFAEGQLIQVERGYVRAPFVRVERGRGLRARVRAPFVNVGGRERQPSPAPTTNQQRPVEPRPVGPAMSTAVADVSNMDWSALRQNVRAGEAALDGQLNRVGAADHWRAVLHVGALRESIVEDVNAPPTEQESLQLQQVLNAYDRANVSTTSRAVASLSGFQTVRLALRELLTPPLQRQRGRLITAAGELVLSFNRLPNASTWADYLRLPDSVYGATDLATHQAAMLEHPAEPSVDEMAPVLARFHAVSRDPRYRNVANLREFRLTHHHLANYVDLLNQPVLTDDDLSLQLEALNTQTSKRN